MLVRLDASHAETVSRPVSKLWEDTTPVTSRRYEIGSVQGTRPPWFDDAAGGKRGLSPDGRWFHCGSADDLKFGLRDPRLAATRPADVRLEALSATDRPITEAVHQFIRQWPMFADGLAHKRVRVVLKEALGAVDLRLLESRTRARLGAVIDDSGGRELDWVTVVARPLAMRFIQHLYELGPEEAEWLAERGAAILRVLDTAVIDPDVDRGAASAIHEIEEWLAARDPGVHDSFLRAILRIPEADLRLPIVVQVLTGAFEPAVTALSGVAYFSSQAVGLRSDFCHEVLRLTPAFDRMVRAAPDDMTFLDTQLGRGTLVDFSIAQANVDPSYFPSPFELRDGRPPHFSLGHGAHYCAGQRHVLRLMQAVATEMAERSTWFQGSSLELAETKTLRFHCLYGRFVKRD